MLEIVISVRL